METSTIKQKLSEPASLEALLKSVLLSKEDKSSEKINQTAIYLTTKGWSRKKIYDVCRYINLNEDLQDEEHDTISNFIDCLTGFIAPTNIIKLPGEPEGEAEFLEYVYSDWWKD